MLVQFTVANFRSFKEETTFNLLAEGADQPSQGLKLAWSCLTTRLKPPSN